MENESKKIRNLLHTDDFDEFYNSLEGKAVEKMDEAILYLETIPVLSTKFVKIISGTVQSLYELRVSVSFNEYRTIIFSANYKNIIQATEIILLNGFLKKSTKDYDKQIKKATRILNNLEL